MRANSFHVRALVWSVVIILVYLAYRPGLTGSLFYDDFANLNRMEAVQDLPTAIDFVFGGTAGPTGRPMALASFLPHANNWPGNSASVLRVNVLIHLANGTLLLILGSLILKVQGGILEQRRFWVALSAAALWLAMPLLASTSLIAVQRMTSLSAFFGLVGLIGFVAGYRWQQTSPKKALLIQLASLGVGTLLATLTKENGGLVPIYALIIDGLLLRERAGPTWLRRARQVPLWIVLAALLLFLSPVARDWTETNVVFGWSPIERLATQLVVLWHYLGLALAPQPTAFGPFHDDLGIISGWQTALSLGLFAGCILVGILVRRITPWLLFALLWYLAGHLLESTVLDLELFFEHRNYLPVYGLCLALAVVAWTLPGHLGRWGPVLLSGYVLVQVAVLYGLTSVWGNPLEAGENWVRRHPNSSRAILHLSAGYYETFGNPSYALPLLDHLAPGCPRCTDVRMQALLYSCGFEDPERTDQRFKTVLESARNGRRSVALLDSLYRFHDLDQEPCATLRYTQFLELVKRILRNPAFRADKLQIHARYHAAVFAQKSGDIKLALDFLAQAADLGPGVMPILQLQVELLRKLGREQDALAEIQKRRLLRHRNETMTDADLALLEGG